MNEIDLGCNFDETEPVRARNWQSRIGDRGSLQLTEKVKNIKPRTIFAAFASVAMAISACVETSSVPTTIALPTNSPVPSETATYTPDPFQIEATQNAPLIDGRLNAILATSEAIGDWEKPRKEGIASTYYRFFYRADKLGKRCGWI